MDDLTRMAWWATRQGLDGSLDGASSAEVFTRTGWARSVGGANPNLADLPDHPIVDRGRIVGLWQFAPDAGEVVWWSFEPAGEPLREAVLLRSVTFAASSVTPGASAWTAPGRAPRLAGLRAMGV